MRAPRPLTRVHALFAVVFLALALSLLDQAYYHGSCARKSLGPADTKTAADELARPDAFHSESNIVPVEPKSSLTESKPPMRTRGVPTFKDRTVLGKLLEAENLTTGVELGVRRGEFAERMLRSWPSCRRYVLVDIWKQQANYADAANTDTGRQEQFMKETLQRVAPFGSKVEVCRNFTTLCADLYAKSSARFDFVYVDARHDYKGVLQDLVAWWPLLKAGGIMAGHDYVTNDDGPLRTGQDWSLNFDGTRDPQGRAVKGAVDDFANEHGLQITVGYRETGWNTWAVRKPYDA